MALSFPLGRQAFMNKLKGWVSEASFHAPTQREITGLEGGDILSAEVAPALWQGTIALRPMPITFSAEIVALLSALEVPGRGFFAYPHDRAGPALDSDASVVGGLSPVIDSYSSANSTITITGLTNGYVISPGDMISWQYSSSPTRYALHRFVEGATVAGGTTGALEVYPHIRGTIAADTPVELDRPFCKALIVPRSTDFGTTQGRNVHGVAFRFRQTLR